MPSGLTFDEAALAAVTDYEINKKPSLPVFRRRIKLHLTPFFTGRRLAGITADDINIKYVAHRQQEGIIAWKGPRKGQRIRDVSNTEINHELKALKLIFNREMKNGRIGSMPHIRLLDEPPPRKGFLEPDQVDSVLSHLPDALRPVVEFAYITGWRLADEVLPLTWNHVDLK